MKTIHPIPSARAASSPASLHGSRLPRRLAMAALGALFSVGLALTAGADTITVTNTADAGPGSLRQAVADANATPGDDTIYFDIPATDPGCVGGVCTIGLTTAASPIVINTTVAIVNTTGPERLIISGNDTTRILFVNYGGSLALSGVTLTRGNGTGGFGGGGGAIANYGTLSVSDCRVTRNYVFNDYGGAIRNDGTLDILDSILSENSSRRGGALYNQTGANARLMRTIVRGNQAVALGSITDAYGGGISSIGSLSLVDCNVSANVVSAEIARGGGIAAYGPDLSLVNCTVAGNSQSVSRRGSGAGIDCGAGSIVNCTVSGNFITSGPNGDVIAEGGGITANTVVLRNSTVSGNSITASMQYGATLLGGGISCVSITLENSTVTGNSLAATGAGNSVRSGGIFVWNSNSITARNTIISGNSAPLDPDLNIPLSAGSSYNLIGNFSAILLAPLADNGGPTQTHALLPGSSAIDAGDPAFDPYSFTPVMGTDQRGYIRVKGGQIDIGAVEAGSHVNAPPVAVPGNNQPAHAGTLVTLDGSGSFDDNTPTAALGFAWSFFSVPPGSAAVLANPTTATPSFTPDLVGDYVVQLVVTDDGIPPLTGAPAFVTFSSYNQAPTAVATATPSLPLIGQTVTLSSAGTVDPENDPISYQWTLTTSPAGSSATIAAPNAATATIVPDVPGTYTVTLTPGDFDGAGTPATATFTASTALGFVEDKLRAAAALAESLPPQDVTSKGNQKEFVKHLEHALKEIQKGKYSKAVKEVDKAIVRTDGFPRRGALDLKGESRDWILSASAQTQLYGLLTCARDVLAGLPDVKKGDNHDDDGDDD